MQSIAEWLEALGLGEYAQRFAENGIDLSALGHLSDQDLKDLGVLLGHRRKLQAAIAGLPGAAPAPRKTAAAPITRPKDAAERRQLTVMFCDLVGSTALSARLDPEDLRAIISTYHRCCTELVERNGGFVAKYMGDGALIYFGYPLAHEDDAERAVAAGLAVVEAVPKLDFGPGTTLRVRIGIATGLVVVGDLLGEGATEEQAVIGETPNLAARLQALAEPDTVVIDAGTRRLLRGLCEYRDLGMVSVKGFGDPVPAWQVVGVSATDSRFEALHSGPLPLVGRDEEIELLLRRWQQIKSGEGRAVFITGEPGIGKSRITTALQERLRGEAHTRLRYFCSPHHQDSALHPLIRRLERAAGFTRDEVAEEKLTKLEALLAQSSAQPEEIGYIAELLSIPKGRRYPLPELNPQKRKEKTLTALLAQMERLAAQQPVLVVYEDVQWIDPTTLELLTLTLEQIQHLPVLLIITARPEFKQPWPAYAHVTNVTLGRIGREEVASLICQVTGGKSLPKEVTDRIIDRTDGVPLFIEELTKTVIEIGVLTDAGDRYTLAGPLPPLAIPTSLNASLLARLDRLAPVREVAQIGAALGRQFTHKLVSAVAPMPPPQLDDALSQLVRSESILRRGTPPDAEYSFKHTLVQDAAYSTLLRSRRQLLHGQIVESLEGQFPEIMETQPEVLARHCEAAGLVEKAIDYLRKAGRAVHEKSEAIETDPVRPLSAAKPNGWALEKRARAEQVALVQREERERIEALEQSTITAGINAWGRLKRDTARLSDERLIGEALLAGRRRCMREVGADKPRGIKYVKANAAWLRETGFHEIQRTRRQTCMLIAENWVEFQAWKKTLPIWRQAELNNSVSAWRAFRTRNRTDRPGWRGRQKTGVTNATAAIEAVKREAPELSHDKARNVAFAVLRAVGFAVPRELVRVASSGAVEMRPI